MTFINCYCKTTWLSLLKAKSDALSTFKTFYKMIETQFGTRIKAIRTDNRTEYTSIAFHEFLRSHGIVNQKTCVNTPVQNGVAERKNRHFLEVARSLFFTMNVPKYL